MNQTRLNFWHSKKKKNLFWFNQSKMKCNWVTSSGTLMSSLLTTTWLGCANANCWILTYVMVQFVYDGTIRWGLGALWCANFTGEIRVLRFVYVAILWRCLLLMFRVLAAIYEWPMTNSATTKNMIINSANTVLVWLEWLKTTSRFNWIRFDDGNIQSGSLAGCGWAGIGGWNLLGFFFLFFFSGVFLFPSSSSSFSLFSESTGLSLGLSRGFTFSRLNRPIGIPHGVNQWVVPFRLEGGRV